MTRGGPPPKLEAAKPITNSIYDAQPDGLLFLCDVFRLRFAADFIYRNFAFTFLFFYLFELTI
jgi:hypothetical protein